MTLGSSASCGSAWPSGRGVASVTIVWYAPVIRCLRNRTVRALLARSSPAALLLHQLGSQCVDASKVFGWYHLSALRHPPQQHFRYPQTCAAAVGIRRHGLLGIRERGHRCG